MPGVISANHPMLVTVDAGLKAFATEAGSPPILAGVAEGSAYHFMVMLPIAHRAAARNGGAHGSAERVTLVLPDAHPHREPHRSGRHPGKPCILRLERAGDRPSGPGQTQRQGAMNPLGSTGALPMTQDVTLDGSPRRLADAGGRAGASHRRRQPIEKDNGPAYQPFDGRPRRRLASEEAQAAIRAKAKAAIWPASRWPPRQTRRRCGG